jgi:DNA ligase (NAD+)
MRVIRTKEEYEALCEEIWHHNRLYFQQAAPEISDEEFDALVVLLEKTEQLHPDWISPTSPTQRIGERPLEGFSEVVHAAPMLSLEKGFTPEDLTAFYDRVCRLLDRSQLEFFADLKMDGLAISVTYEKGQLVRAVTRGDGKVGSDITQNFKTIQHIPLRISQDIDYLEVRGEVYLPTKNFLAMNEVREKEGMPLWANPRNAAAGSLKLLDSRELAKRGGLACVFYGVAQQNLKIHLQSEVTPFLHGLGLPTWLSMKDLPCTPYRLVRSVSEMLSFQDEIHAVRDKLPFGIDGVVFKLNSLDESLSIPPTMKHPRTAIAWKFGAEQVWTQLLEIVVQVGRTGVVTPVAELAPIELSGSTVSRATLHNAEEIERKDIRPLDRVLIEKGGDVIPKVVRSDTSQTTRSLPWKMPSTCPCCQTPLVRDEEEVAWRCPNRSGCSEQLIRRLAYFVGKEGLDVDHVGEKLIRHLFTKGLVRRPHELFLLTKEDLLTIDGIKEKSADNILSGLTKAKTPSLDAFILSLGIRHIGAGTSRRLAEHAKTIQGFLSLTLEDLISIEGIGEEVAQSLLNTISEDSFREDIQLLIHVGVEPQPCIKKEGIHGHPFQNAVIVITGTLHEMTRSEAARQIELAGGKVSETVSKRTSYVVVGDDPGSKFEKAKKLGVTILHEPEFLVLLRQGPTE